MNLHNAREPILPSVRSFGQFLFRPSLCHKAAWIVDQSVSRWTEHLVCSLPLHSFIHSFIPFRGVVFKCVLHSLGEIGKLDSSSANEFSPGPANREHNLWIYSITPQVNWHSFVRDSAPNMNYSALEWNNLQKICQIKFQLLRGNALELHYELANFFICMWCCNEPLWMDDGARWKRSALGSDFWHLNNFFGSH